MQRMIVMTPEIFHKFKNVIEEDKNLSILDQKMKNVLYDKKLKPIQKWYLYRQNLMKYGINKRYVKKIPEKSNNVTNVTFDTGTQTKHYSKRNASTEIKLPEYKSSSTQTEFLPFVTDDVFKYDPKSELRQMDVDVTTPDYEWENPFEELAKTEASKGDTLVERPSLSSDYRIYETSSGDIITVAVPSPEKKQTLRSAGNSISPGILSRFPEARKRKLPPLLRSPKLRTSSVPSWSTYK